MQYTTKTIAKLIGAKCVGQHEQEIRWLLTDSRSLSSPEDSLFFALSTGKGDGHRYIMQLYQRGVRAQSIVASSKCP